MPSLNEEMDSMAHRSLWRRRQRGAASLIVTMILLLVTSVVMLYLNRSIIFEQKTSANQMRSTIALETAEAGMEWVTGMLNEPKDIKTDCITTVDSALTGTLVSFRRKYVQTTFSTTSDVVPATTTYPGCKINAAVNPDGVNSAPDLAANPPLLTCNCPAVPASGSAMADLGTAVQPGFTVAFAAVPGDAEAVRVIVTGCTAQAGACAPGTTANSDATATISSILKLRPLLRAAPAAPLTCGSSCTVGGSFNIINQDVSTGGILVNAGTTIDPAPGVSLLSIPGQPTTNALVSNDTSLSALSSTDTTCAGSAMFNAFFGSTIAQYAASPATKVIPDCGSASACGSLVDAAYAAGSRAFYFPDGFARNSSSGSLGTPGDPVTLVSNQGFDVNGNINIYGMIFANSANVNDLGTGTANIHGALVTCAAYNNNGNGTLEYDQNALNGVRRSTGTMVRVTGSWTDRCIASSANPPVITCN